VGEGGAAPLAPRGARPGGAGAAAGGGGCGPLRALAARGTSQLEVEVVEGSGALLPAAVTVVPVALAEPRTFGEHVLLFPLGVGGAGSPAASPLPGHLLATLVPGGVALAVAALAVSAVAMAVSLVVRPPRSTVTAADRLALGLALAMCLMPATRFGYVVYPLVLLVWFRLAAADRRPATAPAVLPPGAVMSTRPTRTSDPFRTTPVSHRAPASRAAPASPPAERPASLTYSVLCALSRRFSFVEDEIDGLRQVVRPGDVCLDIGAEYGLYTYALAGVAGPEGRVHSFEPLPGPRRVLCAGVRLLTRGRAHPHRIALGDRPRDAAEMSLPYRRGLPVHGRAFVTDGAQGLDPDTEFATERRSRVPVSTVDSMVERAGLPRVDLIKADVEGAEPLVPAGAARTLKRYRPALLLEIEERHLANYGARADEPADRLREAGYAMFRWRGGAWRPADRITVEHRNYLFTMRSSEA
ncbi:FkbM family methyltransferase, partial [Streptomyces sp. Act-28]